MSVHDQLQTGRGETGTTVTTVTTTRNPATPREESNNIKKPCLSFCVKMEEEANDSFRLREAAVSIVLTDPDVDFGGQEESQQDEFGHGSSISDYREAAADLILQQDDDKTKYVAAPSIAAVAHPLVNDHIHVDFQWAAAVVSSNQEKTVTNVASFTVAKNKNDTMEQQQQRKRPTLKQLTCNDHPVGGAAPPPPTELKRRTSTMRWKRDDTIEGSISVLQLADQQNDLEPGAYAIGGGEDDSAYDNILQNGPLYNSSSLRRHAAASLSDTALEAVVVPDQDLTPSSLPCLPEQQRSNTIVRFLARCYNSIQRRWTHR